LKKGQHCKDTNAESALFYFFNLQSVISVPRWNFDDLVGEFTIIPIKFPNMITKIVIQEPVIEIPEKSLETAKPNLRSRLLSTDVKNAPEKVLLPKFQIMGGFAQNDRQFSSSSNDRPCAANAVVALCAIQIRDVTTWTSSNFDEILKV
jgi:hypothetical protein